MRKIKKYYNQIKKNLKTAERIIYISIPLVKNKRLFIKSFSEIYNSIDNSIRIVLLYEKGKIYKNEIKNFEVFFKKYSRNYNIDKELKKIIKEIIFFNKILKESQLEFIKKNKLVLFLPRSFYIIDEKKLKKFLKSAKIFFSKIESKIFKSKYL